MRSKNHQTIECISKGADGIFVCKEAIIITKYLIKKQDLPKYLRSLMAEKAELGSPKKYMMTGRF